MKLLILTQKVDQNDDLLGFFHKWIEEFSSYFETVIVICLEKGSYNLPSNVKVFSLGKELKISKIKILFNFYKLIWCLRNDYDAVFVHMNNAYIVLGGLLWKLWHKRIWLWYTHKSVDIFLAIAEKIVDNIFTASRKSFRLKSNKIMVMGHGIDVEKFRIKNFKFSKNKKFKIITVGRISPVKNYEVLIEAINIIVKQGIEVDVEIIGGPSTFEQKKYFDDLRKIVKEKKLDNVINFVGSVPYKENLRYFQSADLFVHMSQTGSLDKVILESMACGVVVLSSNDASREILNEKYSDLIFRDGDFRELAEKIIKVK
jgi:glycosyltransferase involved in cell wall biosynthesis